MKHLKDWNVCRAAGECPFGKTDGRPFVCAAASFCAGFANKEPASLDDGARGTVRNAGEG